MNTIEEALRAMIQAGVIKYKSFSKCYGLVDVEVTSDVFTEKAFMFEVYEDDWNSCPPRAVASELAQLIEDNDIKFVPLEE